MNYIVLLCSIITIFTTAKATQAQEIFLQANEFYKAGKFEKAYERYEKITHKSAQVHYNLGNCAYKLNKFGLALLHWRRAESNWGIFNRAELKHNISLVKQKLNKQHNKENDKQSFIVALAQQLKTSTISLVRSIRILYLQLLFLFVWISIFLIKRWPVAKRFKIATIPLLLLLCIFGFMLAVKYGLRMTKNGIVTVSKATVRSGPGETFQPIMTVYEGDEGSIKKITDTYSKVSFNGKLGWINNSVFEKI